MARVRRAEVGEAAVLLRRLIERGDLDASSGHGQALVRRIEGAATALDIASR